MRLYIVEIIFQSQMRDMYICTVYLTYLFCQCLSTGFKGSGGVVDSFIIEMNLEALISHVEDRKILLLLDRELLFVCTQNSLDSDNLRNQSDRNQLCSLRHLTVAFNELLTAGYGLKPHALICLFYNRIVIEIFV